ncbi:MAG: glycosyl hydrolase-related protein, partial [Eubacteriales bacterium]|nr:glycosyl hydrolase-related protein [Eubacteriales bacterium]
SLPQKYTGASADSDNIIISIIKLSEDQNGIVIRAYETDGLETDCSLPLPLLDTVVNTSFKPYEIKTLYIDKHNCREIPMTEIF